MLCFPRLHAGRLSRTFAFAFGGLGAGAALRRGLAFTVDATARPRGAVVHRALREGAACMTEHNRRSIAMSNRATEKQAAVEAIEAECASAEEKTLAFSLTAKAAPRRRAAASRPHAHPATDPIAPRASLV